MPPMLPLPSSRVEPRKITSLRVVMSAAFSARMQLSIMARARVSSQMPGA